MLDTNAKTRKQKELVEAFVTAYGLEGVEDSPIVLTFKGQKVTVDVPEFEAPETMTYAKLQEYTEALGHEPVALEESSTDAEAKQAMDDLAEEVGDDDAYDQEDEIDMLAAEPESIIDKAMIDAQALEESEALKRSTVEMELNDTIAALIDDVLRERNGEVTKNGARWAKGARLLSLERLQGQFKALGDRELGRRGALVDYANELLQQELNEKGITDGEDRLSDFERTVTRKAYEAFAADNGGLEATVPLVDQLDEHGNPMTGDDGKPLRIAIGEIAINKAYALASAATPETRDRLAAFAWRYDEKTCKALTKLVKGKPEEVDGVLDEIYSHRVQTETDVGIRELQPDAAAVRKIIGEKIGKPVSELASITIDRGLFEGDWRDVVDVATKAWQAAGNPVNEKGVISNSVLLERLLAYFAPRNHGAQNIVQMLVDADDMTESQAEQFLASYQG